MKSRRPVLMALVWRSLALWLVLTVVVVAVGAFKPRRIVNVILMIGDGMGPEQIKQGRIVELGTADSVKLFMDEFPFAQTSKVTTASDNDPVTDSAAAATAMSIGNKTTNSFIGMLPNRTPAQTILEYAASIGKKTGICTTMEITHATPASFAAHVDNREKALEIAGQYNASRTPDLILGGGRKFFSEELLNNMTNSSSKSAYTLIDSRQQLLHLDFSKCPSSQSSPKQRYLGIFAQSHLPYETERDFSTVPALHELARFSLDYLSQQVWCDENLATSEHTGGFFLLIEGGNIDHGGHENNDVKQALETIEFDKTIKMVRDYISQSPPGSVFNNEQAETLLIVTADHETGGFRIIDTNDVDDLPLPSSELDAEENRRRRIDRAEELFVTWSTGWHTAVNVNLYSNNASFLTSYIRQKLHAEDDSNFNVSDPAVVFDNTDIFHLMKRYFDSNDWQYEDSASESSINDESSGPDRRNYFFSPLWPLVGIFFFVLAVICAVVLLLAKPVISRHLNRYRYHKELERAGNAEQIFEDEEMGQQ